MLIRTLFILDKDNTSLDIMKISEFLNSMFAADPDLQSSPFSGCIVYQYTNNQFRKNINEVKKKFDLVIFIFDKEYRKVDTIFDVGLFAAINQPKLLIASSETGNELINLYDNYIVCDDFTTLQDLNQFTKAFQKTIVDITRHFSYIDAYFSKVWFQYDTKNITIIVSPEFQPPIDGELTSHNFDFLDTVGDKDTILEVFGLLSRRYPHANIEIISASNNRINSKQNIVIIGGPGGPDYTRPDGTTIDSTGNVVCRRISDRIKSNVTYSSDCESMICENEKFTASYDEKGIMTEDFGYFASLKNPYDEKYRVVLLHGIHTLGVVGAARLFSDETNSENNFRILIEDLFEEEFESYSFECFFKVDINYGTVLTPPEIDHNHFFLLNTDKKRLPTRLKVLPTSDAELEEIVYDMEVLAKEVTEKLSLSIGDKYAPQKQERLRKLNKRITYLVDNRNSFNKHELIEEYNKILQDFQG